MLRILVTGNSDDLSQRLPAFSQKGNIALSWTTLPLLKFERISVSEDTQQSVRNGIWDWIIFTSPRTVRFWSETLFEWGWEFPISTRVACIGSHTAKAAEADGYSPDFVPQESGSEGFLSEFLERVDPKALKVLCPMSTLGRLDISKTLSEKGATAEVLRIYATQPRDKEEVVGELPSVDLFDGILFTSPSSIDAFLKIYSLPPKTRLISMGEFTSQALRTKSLSYVKLPQGKYENITEVLECRYDRVG